MEWKWDHITMDFVAGLPQTFRRIDSIWVLVDRLTKSAHFLPVRSYLALKAWLVSTSGGGSTSWGASFYYIRSRFLVHV